MLIESHGETKRRPILIVLHQERSSPGRVGQMLLQKGYDLDIRRPVLGDTRCRRHLTLMVAQSFSAGR